MNTEAFVTTANRVCGPLAIFGATAFLSRQLELNEFTAFLLALSLAQWALQFGYQWIKNGILKTVHSGNFWFLTLCAFVLSSIFVTVFSAGATLQINLLIGASVSFFTMSNGAFYVVATTARLSGDIIRPQLFEILAVSSRWIIGCYICATYDSIAYLFFSMAVVNTIFCLPLILRSRHLQTHKDDFHLKTYVRMSVALLLTDAAASTFMYLDRFIVKEADYVIYSTLGNQASSVLMGAAMAIFLPRLAKKYHAGGNWHEDHQRYFRWLLYIFAATVIGSWLFAPLATALLSPNTPPARFEVLCFSLAQSLHFIFMFTAFQLLLIGKNWITAVGYSAAAIIYAAIVISYTDIPSEYLPILRIMIMFTLTVSGYMFIKKYSKGV